jgi:NADPH:quinone reductase-like Zn-dependent oxidoreductase
MRASGAQLEKIAELAGTGVIKPVLDRDFGFDQTPEALAYAETGRAKGKITVSLG